MNKLAITIGDGRYPLASLAAAVAIGAMMTIASGTPSTAQVARPQSGVADHSLVDNVGYVVRRGYRGAYVVRRGYGYHRGYGYGGYGAGVAGAAVGAAIIGGALAAPYYYQRPYGYYQQPYAYPQPYGYAPGYYGDEGY